METPSAAREVSPPAELTPESFKQLSVVLRRWYFEVGGLYMSPNTRDAYFALQKALTSAHVSPEGAREAGSSLRTATTRDVGSRKQPLTGQGQDA